MIVFEVVVLDFGIKFEVGKKEFARWTGIELCIGGKKGNWIPALRISFGTHCWGIVPGKVRYLDILKTYRPSPSLAVWLRGKCIYPKI